MIVKVCYFTPVFLPDVGGAEYVTDALARQFTLKNHPTHVLTRGHRADLDLPYPVTWFGKPYFPHFRPERIVKHLRRLHAREKFDVFLVNYGRPTGIAAVNLSRETGVPTVLVSHGGDLYEHAEDRNRPHVFRRTAEAYRRADAVIAISPHVEKLIREVRPEPSPVVCIPNGVDPAAMNEPASRPADLPFGDAPFLLALGNFTEYKGFDDAVDAFALALPRLGDTHLAIVGKGKMETEIKARIAKHNLGRRVHLLGQRTGGDKRWLMQRCRFGLMPSIEEGHPIVGLEFMAVGRPIVCSLNPSFDEMFTDGQNACRAPARDAPALADAMVRLHENDPDAMGAIGRQRVEQFAWSAIADRYLEVMGGAVDAAKRSGTARG